MGIFKNFWEEVTKVKKLLSKSYHKTLILLTSILGLKKTTELIFKIRTGKKLDLDNPKTFNEKIQWLKLYWQKKIIVDCADKYEVRKYLLNKQLDFLLNELYQVCDNPNDIEWEKLPSSYVIKTTNACATNIIVKDNSLINKEEVISKINRWLKVDYGKEHLEPHYSKIKPKIIVEKYIESKTGILQDYKFFCFNGRPEIILVIDERNMETGYKKRGYYSLDWKYMDITNLPKEHQLTDAKRPDKLISMIDIAKKLSKDFPFVRVDLYEEGGKIIFGELTFTPHGGMAKYYKENYEVELGGKIVLPNKKYIGFN